MSEATGCLLILIVLVVVGTLGGLFVTSTAVLYHEKEVRGEGGGLFECHYFTGTRTLKTYSNALTGCKRFITVGGPNEPP
ncbi:hypothetical protein [Mesorhizobium sp. M0296]|uniref:hypothetical protein n=1 Tax=unclassified Mesorhizobium TaxID=325217 RepID=UPI00333D2B23